MGRRRLSYGVGLTVCVAVIAGSFLFWHLHPEGRISDDSDSGPRAGQEHGLSTSQSLSIAIVKHTDPRQVGNFSILRTPPEGLPLRMIRTMHGIHSFGMNWALAQRVPKTNFHGSQLWIVPGNNYLCMLLRKAAERLRVSCATTGMVLIHGLTAITLSVSRQRSRLRHRRVIVGIAPDRAHRVLIPTGGGLTAIPLMSHHSFVWRDSATAAPDSVIFDSWAP
jgi:hypothetical protein